MRSRILQQKSSLSRNSFPEGPMNSTLDENFSGAEISRPALYEAI